MSDIETSNISASELNPQQPTTKPPLSEARLAANRANALKSTGPRTTAGKLKSASNSLKHGLFSLKNFEQFVHNEDLALTIVTNLVEEYDAVTPSEVLLLHRLVDQNLRFIQMEYLYGESMRFRVSDILTKPVSLLPALLRELDRLPGRIARTEKLLREAIARRLAHLGNDESVEIEPITDPPPLPPRPACEQYYGVQTDKGVIPLEDHPAMKAHLAKTNPPTGYEMARDLVRDFVQRMEERTKMDKTKPK